jgi:hypothetical protein
MPVYFGRIIRIEEVKCGSIIDNTSRASKYSCLIPQLT